MTAHDLGCGPTCNGWNGVFDEECQCACHQQLGDAFDPPWREKERK